MSDKKIALDPVGRLHDIFVTISDSSHQETVGSALAKAFSVEVNEIADVLRLYADIAHLVVEGKQRVNNLQGFAPDELADFLLPLNQVANVLATYSPQTPWYQFRSQIPAETITGLRLTSRVLARDYPEIHIDPKSLESLLKQVQEVVNYIVQADIPSQLKTVLLKHLDEVAKAIRDFRIHGASGLRDAVDGGIGAAIIEVHKTANEQDKDALLKYGLVFGLCLQLLEISHKSKELIEPVMKAIMGG